MKLDMSIPGIKKYYIGFGVIAVAVLGLTIFTMSLASAAKQDKQTIEKARDIADKLNDYTSKEAKIPENLDEVGASDVPDTIKYTKKSESQYEFCISYKSASDYSTPDLTSAVTGPLLGGYSSSLNDYYADTELSSSYKPSSLYISSYSHKKGEDCQIIEPYLSLRNTFSTNSRSSSSASNTARDTERKSDINAIHAQLEAYYNEKGSYPTLADMNDSSWRSVNMPSLEAATLQDPQGTSSRLVGYATSAYSYSYTTYSDTSSLTCDNITASCAHYTLSSMLSTGTPYSKTSLN